nr:unnamed protein product [Digitaria exilis]
MAGGDRSEIGTSEAIRQPPEPPQDAVFALVFGSESESVSYGRSSSSSAFTATAGWLHSSSACGSSRLPRATNAPPACAVLPPHRKMRHSREDRCRGSSSPAGSSSGTASAVPCPAAASSQSAATTGLAVDDIVERPWRNVGGAARRRRGHEEAADDEDKDYGCAGAGRVFVAMSRRELLKDSS